MNDNMKGELAWRSRALPTALRDGEENFSPRFLRAVLGRRSHFLSVPPLAILPSCKHNPCPAAQKLFWV